MRPENFQEIRLFADEVNRGIIYVDTTGFYNFQKLEGLLKKHGLMTRDYQEVIDRLKKQTGLSDEDFEQEIENAHSRLEQLLGRKSSIEETLNLKRKLEDHFIRPAYENVEQWFRWAKIISANNDFSPINLSDGWVMVYEPNLRGFQLRKESGDKFISILGPRLGLGSHPPQSIFELYVEADGNVFVNQYAKYQQVILEVRNKYLEELSLEAEIGKALGSFINS